MGYDLDKIKTSMRESLAESDIANPDLMDEIVFHMTDWLDDLYLYNQICENPASFRPEEINNRVTRFLTHVPNHLAAAAKLYLDIPVSDIFDVGSTSED